MKTFIAIILCSSLAYAWEIDLSRRQKGTPRSPQSSTSLTQVLDTVLDKQGPAQDLVILHTDTGFIPKSIKAPLNSVLRVYIVNVSQKNKNVSFMLDAFGESHGIYFGQVKDFSLTPKVEGQFSFICPETGALGTITIFK